MNISELYKASGYINIAIWIILVGLIVYKKFPKWQYYKYFYLFTVLITILELIYAITVTFKIKTLFLDYFYKSIEFVLLTLYLEVLILPKKRFKFGFLLCGLFICFQLFNAFWGEGFFHYSFYSSFINNTYLTIISIYILIKQLSSKNLDNLFDKTDFHLVLGIFLIYFFNIFFDILLNFSYNQTNPSSAYMILISMNFLKSLFMMLFIRAILLIKR